LDLKLVNARHYSNLKQKKIYTPAGLGPKS
jgi:hypothetical protein